MNGNANENYGNYSTFNEFFIPALIHKYITNRLKMCNVLEKMLGMQ